MEEILASIRRIIADDEAKPATSERAPPTSPPPASPPPAAAPVKAEKPAPVPAAPPPPKAAAPTPPPAKPAQAATNSQDDIDALLNGLDEATTAEEIRPAAPEPEPEPDVLELTDEMALEEPPAQPSFKKSSRRTISNSPK